MLNSVAFRHQLHITILYTIILNLLFQILYANERALYIEGAENQYNNTVKHKGIK